MRAQVSGIFLEYDDTGLADPTLPTILFIHGYPLSRAIWQPQVTGLSRFARLISLDLRGFGDSEASSGVYSMELLADDCIGLIDHLKIREPILVCGLSMGGYIAFALFKKYPDRVRGLILSSTRAGADSPDAKANRDKAITLVDKEGITAIANQMLPKMYAQDTYTQYPDKVESLSKIMLSASVPGIKGVLAGMRDRPDSTPLLSQVKVPTLLIFGDQDQFVTQAEAASIRAALPAGELHIIPNSGHLLNLEQPEQYNQIIRNFLASYTNK